MAKLIYKIGDLFDNIPNDKKIIIAHIVNNKKVMGAGFVVPLMKYFPDIKENYIKVSDSIPENKRLGSVYFYQDILRDIIVANMFAQDGFGNSYNPELLHPLSYDALEKCMLRVGSYCQKNQLTSIIAPKFGSGLAGGSEIIIDAMIREIWIDKGIDVEIYSLE